MGRATGEAPLSQLRLQDVRGVKPEVVERNTQRECEVAQVAVGYHADLKSRVSQPEGQCEQRLEISAAAYRNKTDAHDEAPPSPGNDGLGPTPSLPVVREAYPARAE